MKTIEFAGQRYYCREIETFPSYLKLGDLVWLQGEMLEVCTVQKDCPYIENTRKHFVHLVLKNALGQERYRRPTNKVKAFRKVTSK